MFRQFARSGAALLFVTLMASGAWAQAIDAEGEALEQALLERGSQVVGPTDFPNSCVECHAAEVDAWRHSSHFATFAEMHRTEEATEIIRALGGRSIRRDAACMQCHYTSVEQNNRLRAMWGISCESCHGQAQDWVEIHALIGGEEGAQQMSPGESQAVETPEQRQARLAKSADLGMIHTEMIYEIASNCFACHTVPDERLVNEGGHRAGSDFELVSWSQGEVRHNLMAGHGNQPATDERKRVMYVVGVLVDLEYTLRNLARSQEEGAFRDAMRERADSLVTRVDALLEAVEIAEVAQVREQLTEQFEGATEIDMALADAVGESARDFAASHDGSELQAVDALIPGEDAYRGTALTQ